MPFSTGGPSLTPLVSILIPAFNAQDWIAETLRSALAQTWQRSEVIVVDDGSTDRTLSIAKQFENFGVRVYTQQNQGAAAARNEAFRLSKGEYIQWLDADDLLDPNKIALQLATPLSERMLLSSGWAWFLHRPQRAVFRPTALWCNLSVVEWLVRKMSLNLHMQTATWLVSRKVAEAAGPWDTKLLGDDDGEYFCRVLMASDGVQFIPGAKVYYRANGNSRLSYIGSSERKIHAHWRSMLRHIEYVRSLEDSPRVRAACVKYLQNWLINFYPEHLRIVEEAMRLAAELGGELREPRLSWKYSWIKSLFGWSMARQIQLRASDVRSSVQRSWDKALWRLESVLRLGSQIA